MDKQALVFTLVALASAALSLLAAIEPKFGQVGGAPIALGILGAGFAIAAAIARRR